MKKKKTIHKWTPEQEETIRQNRNLSATELKIQFFRNIHSITVNGLNNKMARVIGLMDFPRSAHSWDANEIKTLERHLHESNEFIQKLIPRFGKDIDQMRWNIVHEKLERAPRTNGVKKTKPRKTTPTVIVNHQQEKPHFIEEVGLVMTDSEHLQYKIDVITNVHKKLVSVDSELTGCDFPLGSAEDAMKNKLLRSFDRQYRQMYALLRSLETQRK